MKKFAFTILELIFVIIVIGILSVVFIPKFGQNKLSQAANQVISDIRYAQHLAMVDDKYTPINSKWFKSRWEIQFHKNLTFTNSKCPHKTYPNIWAYTIFSDKPAYTGNPNISEIGINPINSNQLLSGGYNNTLCVDNTNNNSSQQSMSNLRLGEKYGITNIIFSGGCRSNVRDIYFDHLGRPFNSMNTNYAYELPSLGWHKLLTSPCDIKIINSSGTATIQIEPETGYVHIL